jgi:hypothetical protein
MNFFARASAGFATGVASCVLESGGTLVGLVVLPALILAFHVFDPHKPLLLPIAVAAGRLCWILPWISLAAAPGSVESLVAGLVVVPALAYWLLQLSLYGIAAYLGCGWAAEPRLGRAGSV